MQYVSTAPGNRSPGRLAPAEHRDAQDVLGDLAIHLEHAEAPPSVASSAVACAVWPSCQRNSLVRRNSRVRISQRRTLRPLVVEERQVAVALDPALVGRPDDRLRRRADGQRLLELLAAAVGDDRHLRREALDVIGLLLEQAHRDEQREVDVLVAGRLEPVVERALGQLPDRVAVGLDDHRALGRAVLGQLGALDDLDVPGGEVVALRGQLVRAHGRPMLADALDARLRSGDPVDVARLVVADVERAIGVRRSARPDGRGRQWRPRAGSRWRTARARQRARRSTAATRARTRP